MVASSGENLHSPSTINLYLKIDLIVTDEPAGAATK